MTADAAAAGTRSGGGIRSWLRDNPLVPLLLILLLLVVVLQLVQPGIVTATWVSSTMRFAIPLAILAACQTLTMLTGGIDLSVGAVVAFAGLLAAGLQAYVPWPVAIVVALAMGLLVGAVNGVLVARFNLQPFIATLATMGSLRGLLYMYSETPQYPADPLFRSLLGGGFIGPMPVPTLLFLIALPIVWFYLSHTVSGRAVYAIGVNPEAVRLAGINVRRHVTAAYVASGFLAALAGVLLASRVGVAQPSVGVGYELDAIAAVVIGGGILGGGGGTVIGVLGGVLALAAVDNVLNLFNVESYYQQFLKGMIILVAVLARRKKT